MSRGFRVNCFEDKISWSSHLYVDERLLDESFVSTFQSFGKLMQNFPEVDIAATCIRIIMSPSDLFTSQCEDYY